MPEIARPASQNGPAMPSPWLMAGAACILALVVAVFTVHVIDKGSTALSHLLAEKGASLIKAFEGGVRTGLRMRVGVRLQYLLEEMSDRQDIAFLAVTAPDGTILAHGNPERVGDPLLGSATHELGDADLASLNPGPEPQWRIMDMEGRRAFVVYRHFLPKPPPGLPGLPPPSGPGFASPGLPGLAPPRGPGLPPPDAPGLAQPDGPGLASPGAPGLPPHIFPDGTQGRSPAPARPPVFAPPVIWVGLDLTPLEMARTKDEQHAIIMGGIVFGVGIAGLLSLYWAQRARISRRLQHVAEAVTSEIVTSLPDGLLVFDAGGRITACNPAGERLLGLPFAALRGHTPEAVLPPVVANLAMQLFQHGLLPDTEVECPCLTAPGATSHDASGGTAGPTAPRSSLAPHNDATATPAATGAPCAPPPAGYPPAPPNVTQVAPAQTEAVQTTTGSEGPQAPTQPVCIPIGLRGGHVLDGTGQRIGSLLLMRDLSDMRRLESEIRRREKLAAMGDLAAGVAHELRNPLSSIKGYATYFGSLFAADSEERSAAKVMVNEVDRLNRVITDLIGLARPSDVAPRPVDVATLVEHGLRLVRQDARAKGIDVLLDVAVPAATGQQQPLLAPLDPDRFTQALLNICLNAMEAMEQGGTLSVRLAPEGQHRLRITVTDTGHGMDAERMARIFDPYFTTKSQGTGLGLAIVLKIVEAHGGTVSVQSQPGKGTAFNITLPASPATTLQPEAPRAHDAQTPATPHNPAEKN